MIFFPPIKRDHTGNILGCVNGADTDGWSLVQTQLVQRERGKKIHTFWTKYLEKKWCQLAFLGGFTQFKENVWNLALKKGTFCEWEFRCGSSEVFTSEKNNLPESPRVLPTLIQPSHWEETHLRKPQSFHDAFSPPSPPFSSPLLHALVNLCRKLNALSSHYFCSVCFCRLCAAAWPWRLRKNEAVTFLSSHNLFS